MQKVVFTIFRSSLLPAIHAEITDKAMLFFRVLDSIGLAGGVASWIRVILSPVAPAVYSLRYVEGLS